MKFTEKVGDIFIPKKRRATVAEYFEKAAIDEVPYRKIGLAVYLSAFLAIVASIVLVTTRLFANFIIPMKVIAGLFLAVALFFIIFKLFTLVFKLYLDSRIYHRVMKMEKVFPEFLSELSLNLTAGLPLEKAIANSLEKEFGPLKEEMDKVNQRVILGANVDDALRDFANRYDSTVIQESFELILTSWKKGASTPPLINRIVDNLDQVRFLRKKVIASVTSYKIFLTAVTIVITPAMFALSYYLLDLIRAITNRILMVSRDVVLPFAINPVRINDNHFILFSSLAVILVSICSAAIISVIKEGTIKEYKQIFLYSAASFVSYRIFLFLFSLFFSLFSVV